MESYYIIYKITNQINGKIYIGSHKTKDLNDSYMGSGKYLKYAQTKYGIEHFTKEILFVFDNPQEMYLKEVELVNEEFIAEQNTYNIKQGGFGGWDYINSNEDLRKSKNRKARRITDEILQEKYGDNWRTKLAKIAYSAGNNKNSKEKRYKTTIQRHGPDAFKTFLGNQHTEESKRQIGIKNSIHQTGKKNSQFGTKWIYNIELKVNKKIHKNDPVPDGWVAGRKMEFYKQ